MGNSFVDKNQGVYIISTSNDPNENLDIKQNPLFDNLQIDFWISKLPLFEIDNSMACSVKLKERLAEFWLPDKNILYIGKGSTRRNKHEISNRVGEYFSSTIGSTSPNRVGHWLKALTNLTSLNVYYGYCSNPADTGYKMLNHFMENVSPQTLSKLYDKNLPLPSANIKYKGNKKHGFINQVG